VRISSQALHHCHEDKLKSIFSRKTLDTAVYQSDQ
jgi:hypothetical protein